jgi:hypothetical protein
MPMRARAAVAVGRRLLLALCAASLGLVTTASGALASSAFNEYRTNSCTGAQFPVALRYTAATGEVNKVTVAELPLDQVALYFGGPCEDGTLHSQLGRGPLDTTIISDPGARSIETGRGCDRVLARLVTCVSRHLIMDLGDGGDYLALDVPLNTGRHEINAGSGNDTLRTLNVIGEEIVDCGDGIDSVTADAGDQLTNCENVTRIP